MRAAPARLVTAGAGADTLEVDLRRGWPLAGAVPVVITCTVAAGDPALRPLGDAAVLVMGLLAAVTVWVVAARHTENRLSWRLLATAPLLPVLGAGLAAAVHPPDPLRFVALRWLPTVPAYVLVILGILSFVDRARLRAGGQRLAVEVALFLSASLVVVQMLVVGPDGRWSDLELGGRLILGAAVLVTSATMAAALTLLGVIEARRQRMALVLLAMAVTLTAGRGLATSALLSGHPTAVDVSRFLVVTGLSLLTAAVFVDVGRGAAVEDVHPAGRRSELGQLLPHTAMAIAVTVVGVVAMSGRSPSSVTFVGAVLCVVLAVLHRWVTGRDARRMAARLQRSEAYFRSLVRSGSDAVVILDDDLCITWASPALERVLGSAAADLVGHPLLAAVHPEDITSLSAALRAQDRSGGLLLLRLPDADGIWRYLEASVSDQRRDADVGAVVLHCRDMTERHEREQALQSIAYTDPMTGLPNRAGFLRVLDAAPAASDGAPSTLLMIELDGLAAARQHVGREITSLVVAEVGRRLRATVRGEDVVARMGGGAFAVLAGGTADEADRLAARCLAVVEQPIVTPAGILDLTAGVGLVAVEAGLDVDDLLGRADLAVRDAHATGAGWASRYRPALGEKAARRDRMRADLEGACARGEIFLLFQPVVSLTEHRVTGLEALLRWRHPTLGEVLPVEFVPIAERAGLIGDLQRWVMAQASAVAVDLPASAGPVQIALNASPGYVAGGTLVSDVEAALRRSGLPPERLVLEISAAAAASDDERVGLDISTLRLMGVHVALDGFGASSSELAQLTRLPIDILKLDRSFIARLDRDPQSRALCESIVTIGRALGFAVVAEGVESSAQLAALSGFGCGFAQGFLISRPVPRSGVPALLGDGMGLRWPGIVSSV